MKNIGIITFHYANNYGAFLQAYSLERAIISFGEDNNVKIIDYKNKNISNEYKIISLNKIVYEKFRIKYILKRLINIENIIVRNYKFYISRKKLDIDRKKKYENYDIIFAGSDQIWNPEILKGFDPYYFLDIQNYYGKKATYAASFGIDLLSEKQKVQVKELIEKINYISVREKDGIFTLQELTNKKLIECIDPVFLLSKEQWIDILRNNFKEQYENDYILVYYMGKNSNIMQDAYELSKKTNLKIVKIAYEKNIKREPQVSIKLTLNPFEFIKLFYNAKYVLTNSFHGTAFSIIFQKDFCSYKIDKKGNRIFDLLRNLNLKDRYVSKANGIFTDIINWKETEILQKALVKNSINYLVNVIKGE